LEQFRAHLEELFNDLDPGIAAKGLAFCVNQDLGRLFYLPFTVPGQLTVGEGFAVRELLRGLSESAPYRVLVLSREVARVFEADRDELREAEFAGRFPLTETIPGVETQWDSIVPPMSPHGGIDPGMYDTRANDAFMHRVDLALDELVKVKPLPLVIVGVEENLGAFKKVTKHHGLILASLCGSYIKTPLHDLGAKVWPLAEAAFRAGREGEVERFEDAIGTHKFASGLHDVWHAAQEGQIETLLLDEDFHYSVLVENLGALQSSTAGDVVDEVIAAVLRASGQVVFCEAGKLADHGEIAATLRYALAEGAREREVAVV